MFSEQQAPMWFRPAWPRDYPVEYYEENKQYDPTTVFYYDMYGPYHQLILSQLAQGHKIIYDAKNEHYVNPDKHWILDAFRNHPGQGMFVISGHTPQSIPGVKVVATPYWYWILDQQKFLNYHYDSYAQAPTHQNKFFMQMSLSRPDRDNLWKQVQPILPMGLYSYKSQGVHLPNDVNPDQVHDWQRYMNWDWINSCSITLVIESNLDDHDITGFSVTQNDNKFICEKTYKPIAYGHAFLLASTRGNLAHVREQGFETFPELWDESYDDLPDYQQRVDAIVTIIKNFDHGSLNNPVVQQKIAHNRQRFFDTELAARLLRETVVEPVIAFVNE